MKTLIFATGILGAALFIVASIWGGAQIQGYSIIRQYISESYASGLPNTEFLRNMYVASGGLMALFGGMAPSALPKSTGIKVGFYLFAIFYGLATVMTGFFPCDLGCEPDPEKASLSQFIHNSVGFLTYAIVPFCLMAIGFSAKKKIGTTNFSKTSIVCGILALAFVVFLFASPSGAFIGLFQRIVEGSILFWVIFTSFYIRRTN